MYLLLGREKLSNKWRSSEMFIKSKYMARLTRARARMMMVRNKFELRKVARCPLNALIL